jgi:ubiquinone biosynthesis accessory factor UbiJ
MTPMPLAAAVEVALNRFLNLEPAAREALQPMTGTRIAVCLQPMGWRLVLDLLPGTVRVGADETTPAADAEVEGSVVQLALRAAEMARGAPFSAQGLRVRGDAELLRRFAAAVGGVGVDLEEWLAPWLGGAAAHRATGLLQGLFGWGRQAVETLGLNTAEYLREETYDLARREDVEDWMDRVDLLRDGVDRLEARLKRRESQEGRG